MNILGIGTDMVDKKRISRLIDRFGEKFVQRILSHEEQAIFVKSSDPASYLAKRFAAKEAISKALGTGMGTKLAFNEISVTNEKGGKPVVHFLGNSRLYISTLNLQDIFISLSDEKEYALSFVVIVAPIPLQ